MHKLVAVSVLIGLSGCTQGEDISTVSQNVDVYASIRESKITRLYIDDELQITVTDDGSGAVEYSPLVLTLPGDLAFMVAMCAQQMPEYEADIRYYTTGPE